MSVGERPGVYTSYEIPGVVGSGEAAGTVGIAACGGTAGEILEITTYNEAIEAFGENEDITELIKILIMNGVNTIKAATLGDDPDADDYGDAFEKLASAEDVKVIVCDSTSAAVHAAMKDAIEGADIGKRHKIGVVEGTGNVAALTASAGAINSERMVMVAPTGVDKEENAAVTGSVAAALAGAIVCTSDPTIPLNGAALHGIAGLTAEYTDNDITDLVHGGVTPLESISGGIYVVRGITTRTTSSGTADAAYRELTTTLIIDDVLPHIRRTLAKSFSRTKNNERTRGAIRTKVIVELEKKLAAEIIEGYDNVSVAVNADDPTVCDVSFDFAVAHGLNEISLTANITV